MSKKNDDTVQEENFVEFFEEGSMITLFDESDKPIEFYEVAAIEYGGKFYELLQPVEPVEGMMDDEAVIFECNLEGGEDDKNFMPVFDEDLLNAVFSVYLKAVSDFEYESDSECCGCGSSEECDCGDIQESDCDCSGCGDSSCAAHPEKIKQQQK